MEEDPYIWLENLEDLNVKRFIEKHNERFREFIGDLSKRFENDLWTYYKVPIILNFEPTERGIYILTREMDGHKVKLLHWDGELEELASSKSLGKYAIITDIYASEDGSKLGFHYSEAGEDEGTLRIIDAEDKEVIDELKGVVENIMWIDETRYYYTRFYRLGRAPDGAKAPVERIILRDVSAGKEEIVFGTQYGTNYLMNLVKTWDPEKVLISVDYGWVRSVVYGGLRADPSTWRMIFNGRDYRALPVGFSNDSAYIVYYDGEGLGRILRVLDDKIEEVVKEDKYPLRKALLVKDKIYAEYLVDASSRIRVYDLNGKLINEYSFSQPSTIRLMKFFKDKVYCSIETFTRPPSVNIIEDESIKEIHGYEVDMSIAISVREEWTKSSDGTPIHMFIIEDKTKSLGRAVVYGYGGFAFSLTPFFSPLVLTLVKQGYVFVVANLRGGGEYGEKWHRMGMRENKQNVFEDYKAVLKHIRSKGLKTIGLGSSNGGLLIAATLTQAPELLDVALIGYPLTDMLRFHKLYIGNLWTTEYGNPDDPKDRAFLEKYSPYHNIKRGVKYPPTLVFTGLHDDRVHPGHAFKFVAKLEEVGAPVYLRVETVSGHRGASPEVKIKELADIIAFMEKAVSTPWQ